MSEIVGTGFEVLPIINDKRCSEIGAEREPQVLVKSEKRESTCTCWNRKFGN